MTLHRFFIEGSLIKDKTVFLPEETSHQISRVLRLQAGDQIIILDDNLNEFLLKLEKVDKKQTVGFIQNKTVNKNEPKINVTLYQSLIPKDKFELILEKCCEIGVKEFVPIITKHTQIHDFKKGRWEKILKEAAEQCQRGKIPSLKPPLTFNQAVDEAVNNGEVLIAWEKQPQTKEYKLSEVNKTITNISIFIGPEGGFSQQEIDHAFSKGAKLISLGKRTLRSETAAIVASAKLLIFK